MRWTRSKEILGIGVVVAGVVFGQLSPHDLANHGQEMGQPPHPDDDHGNEPRTDSAQLTAPTMTSTPRSTSSFAIEECASEASTLVIAALLLGATGYAYSRRLFA